MSLGQSGLTVPLFVCVTPWRALAQDTPELAGRQQAARRRRGWWDGSATPQGGHVERAAHLVTAARPSGVRARRPTHGRRKRARSSQAQSTDGKLGEQACIEVVGLGERATAWARLRTGAS